MRVYYAVWEDVEEGEGGFRSGAISTEGGGNLHWDDNQFQVVHKDDYDKLKERADRLAVVAQQLDRWRTACASQDMSDASPARRAMFKALDYALKE